MSSSYGKIWHLSRWLFRVEWTYAMGAEIRKDI